MGPKYQQAIIEKLNQPGIGKSGAQCFFRGCLRVNLASLQFLVGYLNAQVATCQIVMGID